MKTLTRTLGVARSNIIRRDNGDNCQRRAYNKADDRQLLSEIRAVIAIRPTYGYRRVHAILNDQRVQGGLPAVNHKRIYRVMKQNNLLLQRFTGRPHNHAHKGKIITIRSNLRWCSDVFEIPCWNRDIVRVIFSLDCCDREVLSYIATTGWINAETVRDLMLQSMEYRFGKVDQLPHTIEWLSDNGLYYLAKDTVLFGSAINLKVCNTPYYSPQSNGMAEAFVKTFKRDYVYVHDRPDARTVLAQIHNWIEDYNDYHPHKGLKMKSPRGYLQETNG
jgi:putative transposase